MHFSAFSSSVHPFSFKASASQRLPHIESCICFSLCDSLSAKLKGDMSVVHSALSGCDHPSWTALGGYYFGAINTASWGLNEMIVGVISSDEGHIWCSEWLQRRCHPVECLPSGANVFAIKRNPASTTDGNHSNNMLNWSDMMMPWKEADMNIKSILSPLNICTNVHGRVL